MMKLKKSVEKTTRNNTIKEMMELVDLPSYAGFIQLCWVYPALLGLSRSAGFIQLCWVYPALLGLSRSAGFTQLCWVYPAKLGMLSTRSAVNHS